MAERRTYGTGSTYWRKDGMLVGTIETGWTADGKRRRKPVYLKGCPERCPDRCRHWTALRKKLAAAQRDYEDHGTSLNSRITVKQWGEDWLKIHERKARPKTFATDASTVRRWFTPTIGHRRLDALTPADVRAVMQSMREADLKPSSMIRAHGCLMTMLRAAMLEGHRVPERVLLTPKPNRGETDRDAMTVPQLLDVLGVTATLPHGSRWLFQMLYGCRQKEALGLTWDCIDFDNGTVSIEWQLQALPYKVKGDKKSGFRVPDGYEARHLVDAYHLTRPKTGRGKRVVPMPQLMHDALKSWRDVAPASPHDLVWPTVTGRPCYEQYDRAEWYAIQCTAAVGNLDSGRWFHTHEARHALATLLREMGVDPIAIREIMGWSKDVETYIHIRDDVKRDAMNRVAQVLALPPAS